MYILFGTVTHIDLKPYVQFPLCEYKTWYTVTLYEKLYGPDSRELKFHEEREGEMYGEPELVYLIDGKKETDPMQIVIDANDFKLVN